MTSIHIEQYNLYSKYNHMAQIPKPYAVISVIQPVLQQPSQNIPPFVTYLVGGTDPRGVFNIRRRYRQFLLLRNKLVQRFIGIYIPPIPSKRTANNTEQRYVEQRRKFLNYFCQKIASKPFLFDSDIFQTFLRGDPDFERAARLISTQEYALIANVYELQFQKQAEQSDMAKIILQLQAQNQILKSIDKKLSVIREQILTIAQAKNQFVRDFSHVFKTTLPKFQKQFISKHDSTGKSQLLSNNESFKANLDEYLHFCQDNLLEDYAELLNYDIREARALLQAMQSRKSMENTKVGFQSVRRSNKEEYQNLKNGRMTLKSIFTSGNKQAQMKDLQNQIPQLQRNEKFLTSCLPLSAISIHSDIIQYKMTRSLDYLAKLQILARKSIRLVDFYGNVLNISLENNKFDEVE